MKSIKEQIKEKMEEIQKYYDYIWEGTKKDSFCVTTHDGFTCELHVEIVKGGRVLVIPQFGFLEIEGSINKESSSDRDTRLLREFTAHLKSYREGLQDAVENLIGIKNPDYNKEKTMMSIFNMPRKYTNEKEINRKVDELFNAVYSVQRTDEYKEFRFKNYALREYILEDLEISFCKEIKVIIPISYKNR